MSNGANQIKPPKRASLGRLARVALALGGRPLPEFCRAELIEGYKGAAAGGRTCGCGFAARVMLPYEDRHGEPQFATVCGHCDGAAEHFPRVNRTEITEVEPE